MSNQEPTDQGLVEKIDAPGQSRCENCAFWRRVEGSDSTDLCKAGDPRVGPRNNAGVLPIVSGDESCGKYEQSSEQSLEAKLVGDLEMRRRQRLELAEKAER